MFQILKTYLWTTWTAQARIYIYGGLAFLLLVCLLIFSFKGCGGKTKPAIDEKSIQAINSQNEAIRRVELEKVINENIDVIKTNDNRTAITDLTVNERNKAIAEKVKTADAEIVRSKQFGKNISAAELEELLMRGNTSK